jgi:hypothetical protein
MPVKTKRRLEAGESTGGPRPTLPQLLWRVLVPCKLRTRAAAAACLPTWLAAIVAIVSILLAVEIISYINAVAHEFLDVMFRFWEGVGRVPEGAAPVFLEVAIRHVRPHVIPAVLSGPAGLMAGLWAGLCLLILLESMNVVLLGPLAVGAGEWLIGVLRRTRRVLLAFGGVWLLEWSLVGLILFLAGSAVVLRIIEAMYLRVPYTLLDDLSTLGLEVCLAALLLGWVVQLLRASAYVAPPPPGPLDQRCSYCGYLLAGVPEGSCCRECGHQDPAEPDRRRTDSPWLRHRAIGWYRALTATSWAVVYRPAKFFARVRTLTDVPEAIRFVRWNLWLSMAAWLLAVPGIATALIEPDDIDITGKMASCVLIAVLAATGSALASAMLIGLIISVLGYAIGRARDEPAWRIAATGGCYLAAVLPRVAAAQALWLTGLFTIEQVVGRGLWLRLVKLWWTQTGIPWEILLGLLFGAPMVLGLVVLIRTTAVCYRNVRYACH